MSSRKYKRSNNGGLGSSSGPRYQRVDLDADDEFDCRLDDDESLLKTELGIPNGDECCCCSGRCCRSLTVLCTVLLTLAGLAFVVVHTVFLVPKGIDVKKELVALFVAENSTAATEGGVAENATTSIDGGTTTTTFDPPGTFGASPMYPPPQRKKREVGETYQVGLSLFDATNAVTEGVSVTDRRRTGGATTSKEDYRTTINTTTSGTNNLTTSKKDHSTTSNSSDATTSKNDHNTTATTEGVQQNEDMTQNGTTESIGDDEDGIHGMDTLSDNMKNVYEQYKVMVIVAGICLEFFCILTVCCVVKRCRARRMAKKRHFTRLVNDLNASERFTLVAPSDDESD